MNKEETAATVVAVGLMLLGLSTIIVSEAIYSNSLENQIQKKDKEISKLKRYYKDAINRLDSDQLIQHAHKVGDELKFESIVKDF